MRWSSSHWSSGSPGLTWLVVTGQGSRRGWVAGLITAARCPGAGRRRVGVLPEHPAGGAGRQCLRSRASGGGRGFRRCRGDPVRRRCVGRRSPHAGRSAGAGPQLPAGRPAGVGGPAVGSDGGGLDLRIAARAGDPRAAGRSGRGHAGEQGHRGRGDAALARLPGAQRRGRGGRGDPGCGRPRAVVHLPASSRRTSEPIGTTRIRSRPRQSAGDCSERSWSNRPVRIRSRATPPTSSSRSTPSTAYLRWPAPTASMSGRSRRVPSRVSG